MGCCAGAQADLSNFEGLDVDLPLQSVQGITDRYVVFELGLPFPRTLLSRFIEKVKLAEASCGDEGYVTIDSLAQFLTTPAWRDLKNPES